MVQPPVPENLTFLSAPPEYLLVSSENELISASR